MPGVAGFGGRAHQALIDQVVAHYAGDDRVRAAVVFDSVGAGSWHEAGYDLGAARRALLEGRTGRGLTRRG